MIITKEFEVGMNIDNTVMFFADDSNILNSLRRIYTGKCLFGANIIRINRVIKHSECIINQDGNPNFGVISVIFEASAEIFVVGEIINGVKIDNIGVDVITGSTPRASIILRTDQLLRYLKPGQIISVRVGATRYTRGESKISVNAVMMLPQSDFYIYKTGQLSAAANDLLNDVRKRIEYEEAEKSKIKSEIWTMFDTLIYAYKTPQTVNIIDFASAGNHAYVGRDPAMGTASGVCGYDSTDVPHAKLYPMPNFDAVMLVLLEDYCAGLRTVREMVTAYDGVVNEHKNLWKIFIEKKI